MLLLFTQATSAGYVVQKVDEDLFSAGFGAEIRRGKTGSVCYLICIVAFSMQSIYQVEIDRFENGSEYLSLDILSSPGNFG